MCPLHARCSRPHHAGEGAERRRPSMGRMLGLQHSTTGEALFIREQQNSTGLRELTHGAASMSHLEYKGYNKELQEKVFRGAITKINVTLIESSRQLCSLEPYERVIKFVMNQNFLYWYLRQGAHSRTPGSVNSRRTSRSPTEGAGQGVVCEIFSYTRRQGHCTAAGAARGCALCISFFATTGIGYWPTAHAKHVSAPKD